MLSLSLGLGLGNTQGVSFPAPDHDWDASVQTGSNGVGLATFTESVGGKDATQSTASLRPLFTTNAINGLAALDFDGGDDGYVTALTIAAPYTIILVFKTGAGGGARRIIQGSNNWLVGVRASGVDCYAGGFLGGTYDPADDEVFIAAVVNTGSVNRIYVNGVDYTVNTGNVDAPGTFYFGASGAFAEPAFGKLGQCRHWTQALSAANLTAATRAMGSKWGVTVA